MKFPDRIGTLTQASVWIAALTIIFCFTQTALATGSQERTLYSFSNSQSNGPFDMDGLIADSSGNLYGTARQGGPQGFGVVFEVSPPSAGGSRWTQTVLYDFQDATDAYFPMGGLIFDSAGNLYGTCAYGGPGTGGSVFELSPPTTAGQPWTETTLHDFSDGSDGATPVSGVVLDPSGNVYGATYYGGTSNLGIVFRLSPPVTGGAWTETILHTFTGSNGNDPGGANPNGGLVRNSQGALFGTTNLGGSSDAGVVFKFLPPAAGSSIWREQVLYSFTGGNDGGSPTGNLAPGPGGSFYGAAYFDGAFSEGTVYQVIPPAVAGGSWTETTIYAFTGGTDEGFPYGVTLHNGALFGTTNGGGIGDYGTVFELTNQGSSWTEATLHTFSKGDGDLPTSRLLYLNGAFYGTTLEGGRNGDGVLYEIIP